MLLENHHAIHPMQRMVGSPFKSYHCFALFCSGSHLWCSHSGRCWSDTRGGRSIYKKKTFHFSQRRPGEVENTCIWDQRGGVWPQHGILPLLPCLPQVSFCPMPNLLYKYSGSLQFLTSWFTRFIGFTTFTNFTRHHCFLLKSMSPGLPMLRRTRRWLSLGSSPPQPLIFPSHKTDVFSIFPLVRVFNEDSSLYHSPWLLLVAIYQKSQIVYYTGGDVSHPIWVRFFRTGSQSKQPKTTTAVCA